MIGNDVVDLQLAAKQSRWQSLAFQQKVLHPEEVKYYCNKILNFNTFWKLWCIKETAYKAQQRIHNHAPIFNPFSICTEPISKHRYQVITPSQEFEVSVYETSAFIYAYTNYKNLISFQNFELIDVPKSHFNANLSRTDVEAFIVKNQNGVPFQLKDRQRKAISITHHGAYFAYVELEE